MCQASAMSSMVRVLAHHADALIRETRAVYAVPPVSHIADLEVSVDVALEISGDCYGIDVTWQVRAVSPKGEMEFELKGPTWGIDELAAMFPDCNVGY